MPAPADPATLSPGDSLFLPDAAATIAAGHALASSAQPGDVIALTGGLGAGKTHFSKGFTSGLGFPSDVTSPTFSLVHEYLGGRLPVFHFDFYRPATATEIIALGWDDYLDTQGICLVEWADRFPDLLPPHTSWWHLEPDANGRRLTRLAGPPQPSA
jgi:tRNA threonylcarbamoyladenosine biosynthesis protein TsaE